MANFKKRFSPRKFDGSEISVADIEFIFEIVRWAPSAYNEQPWSFKYALRQDQQAFEDLLSVLVPSNQEKVKDAAAIIICVARREQLHDGLINNHAWYDVGQSAAYLTMAALERDLYVRQMGGFNPKKARELFNLPSGYDMTSAMAIGRPLPDDNAQKEGRERKALVDMLSPHNLKGSI